MRIRPDTVSIFFDVLAIVELLFFTTQGGALFQASVIASLLLIAGLVLDPLATKGNDEADDEVDQSELSVILLYAVASVSIFYALSLFVPAIPAQYTKVLSVAGPLALFSLNGLFVVQIAVSESEFFHRMLTNLFASRISYLGFPAVGGIAVVYHFFVYGDSVTNLIIVFGAFTALAFIAWHTGRVSPVIIGHVVINGIASGLFSLSSLGLPVPAQAIASPVAIVGVLLFVRLKK